MGRVVNRRGGSWWSKIEGWGCSRFRWGAHWSVKLRLERLDFRSFDCKIASIEDRRQILDRLWIPVKRSMEKRYESVTWSVSPKRSSWRLTLLTSSTQASSKVIHLGFSSPCNFEGLAFSQKSAALRFLTVLIGLKDHRPLPANLMRRRDSPRTDPDGGLLT